MQTPLSTALPLRHGAHRLRLAPVQGLYLCLRSPPSIDTWGTAGAELLPQEWPGAKNAARLLVCVCLMNLSASGIPSAGVGVLRSTALCL